MHWRLQIPLIQIPVGAHSESSVQVALGGNKLAASSAEGWLELSPQAPKSHRTPKVERAFIVQFLACKFMMKGYRIQRGTARSGLLLQDQE